ncbi:MAG: PP2C family protein-serine/threonine phosphatase [Acidobacteriota bacterium]
MSLKNDLSGMRQRLFDFAARFEQQTAPSSGRAEQAEGPSWWGQAIGTLRDLFTRDVTHQALKDLVRREIRQTFHFFTRQIDFGGLRRLPWYQRYPGVVWAVFQAMAYRLSPPRRIVFALAIFAFVLGLIPHFNVRTEEVGGSLVIREGAGRGWWFFSVVLLVILLLMELRDKLDLKGDLEIAREIQFGLVPLGPYHRNDFEIRCTMRPANTVGGDYVDLIELDQNRTAIVVGDVSGKGMPAALLMALLQGSLRTLITAELRGPDLIARLNDHLCSEMPRGRLITLFYGELDTESGELWYVNAGHNAPFLIRTDGRYERLDASSMVLGVMNEASFLSCQTHLNPADHLILFTDGIPEAFDGADAEYGEERLRDFLLRNRSLPQEDLFRELLDDVMAFCGDALPRDDMTLMSIVRKASAS